MSRIGLCEEEIRKTIKLIQMNDQRARGPEDLLYSQQDLQYPKSFFNYWTGLALVLGADIEKLNLSDLFYESEVELAKRDFQLVQEDRDPDSYMESKFSEWDGRVDNYWLPFSVLNHKGASLQFVMTQYCKASTRAGTSLSQSRGLLVCLLARFAYSMIGLGNRLLEKTARKESAQHSQIRSQNNTLNASTLGRAFNEGDRLLANQLYETVKARIDDVLVKLKNIDKDADGEAVFKIVSERRDLLVKEFGRTGLNKSQTSNFFDR
jgi:hypothetical protein